MIQDHRIGMPEQNAARLYQKESWLVCAQLNALAHFTSIINKVSNGQFFSVALVNMASSCVTTPQNELRGQYCNPREKYGVYLGPRFSLQR